MVQVSRETRWPGNLIVFKLLIHLFHCGFLCENVFCLMNEFPEHYFLKGREISSSSLNKSSGSTFPLGVISSQGLARRQSTDWGHREGAREVCPQGGHIPTSQGQGSDCGENLQWDGG